MTNGHSRLMAKIWRHIGHSPQSIQIYADTSNFFAINRGDVLALGGSHYLITGTACEQGFGLDGEPKHWVKRAVDCETGEPKIIKLVFLEQFVLQLGEIPVRYTRSPAKEARVLE